MAICTSYESVASDAREEASSVASEAADSVALEAMDEMGMLAIFTDKSAISKSSGLVKESYRRHRSHAGHAASRHAAARITSASTGTGTAALGADVGREVANLTHERFSNEFLTSLLLRNAEETVDLSSGHVAGLRAVGVQPDTKSSGYTSSTVMNGVTYW